MLAAASSIRIGATESTILPLVQKYRGYKWTPEPLSAPESWVDRAEYDYQKSIRCDHKYSMEMSPFGLLATGGTFGQRTRTTLAIRAVMNVIPARLRGAIGLRDWGAGVDLSTRDGRIQSIRGTLLVEGRSNWLGHEWRYAAEMPDHRLRGRAFTIDSGILEMENNGGMLVQDIFTPDATAEQSDVARELDVACLGSFRGCAGLCDIAPRTVEYARLHPDAAGNPVLPKCR